MSRTRVPAIDGWFTMDVAEPRLIGTRCSATGSYFFPPERTASRAPGAIDSTLDEVELSRRGRLWSYTNAGYQPPAPYIAVSDPYKPFCIAAVELEDEQITVLGQVVDSVAIDDLTVGQEMELVLDVLYSDDDHDYVIWKWAPVNDAAPSAPTDGGQR